MKYNIYQLDSRYPLRPFGSIPLTCPWWDGAERQRGCIHLMMYFHMEEQWLPWQQIKACFSFLHYCMLLQHEPDNKDCRDVCRQLTPGNQILQPAEQNFNDNSTLKKRLVKSNLNAN